VIFALFACLAACVAVQALAAAVICGRHALAEEALGRERLAARDECLVELMERARSDWGPSEKSLLEVEGGSLPGLIASGAEGGEWALIVEVDEQPGSPSLRTTALVERGRDGLDLPVAALVASRVWADAARIDPWLAVEDETACAYTREVQGVTLVGRDCVVMSLESDWTLGDGWRSLLVEGGAWDDECMVIFEEAGMVVGAPNGVRETSKDHPILLVVFGGTDLDLRYLGEIWGTVVVDEGSVLMEGTVVHGAVCATEDVDVGTNGRVVYENEVLEWARDRSLTRTRLVPGSRREVRE